MAVWGQRATSALPVDTMLHGALHAAYPGGVTPAYLDLPPPELERRAAEALQLLGPRCLVCPRLCKVDRRDVHGLCAVGRFAVVASYFPHFGEEDCLRGHNGSGTIFFSGCNLRCVFCQNWDISWGHLHGVVASPVRLATVMLELQSLGCHNVNFVTPEHVVPQILEALPLAIEGGLRLPLVYNTSAYDSLDSLRLLDGVMDVYMPDFKLWTREAARRYLKRADYPDVARTTIREMHRQVGDLVLDEHGLARRGVLLRHLVMPGMPEETSAILRFVAAELGPDCYVNLMAQYYPSGRVGRDGEFPELDRRLVHKEYAEALDLAEELGLRLDPRSRSEGRGLARTG